MGIIKWAAIARDVWHFGLQTVRHTISLKPSTTLAKRKSVFLGPPFNHTLSRNPQVNGGFRVMERSPREVSEALQRDTLHNFQKQITGRMVSPAWCICGSLQLSGGIRTIILSLLCKHIFIRTLYLFAFLWGKSRQELSEGGGDETIVLHEHAKKTLLTTLITCRK